MKTGPVKLVKKTTFAAFRQGLKTVYSHHAFTKALITDGLFPALADDIVASQ